MMLEDRPKLLLGLAFAAGILLTLGYKDLYPDLERRFQSHRRQRLRPRPSQGIRSEATGGWLIVHDTEDDQWPSPHLPAIGEGIESTIGNTPLIRLECLSDATGCEILGKAEFLNGAGNSPKDRVALNMIRTAEAEGLLVPGRGDTIYEGTVGSTGISLAVIARARGYKAHICMPSDQSQEKSDLLTALGATVERVPPASIVDPRQFVNLARARAAAHTSDPDSPSCGYFANQFENPANHLAHLHTTGGEILAQTFGRLDAFVAGAGTGGTLSGVAMALRRAPCGAEVRVVLADPHGSGLYNKVKHGVMFARTEREGTRRRNQVDSIVEGIGINRVTANFEVGRDLIDDAVRVTDDQAVAMARLLVEKEGLFLGSSSAVNCVAAATVAKQLGPGHRIVTILCDSGNRHLSKFWARAGDIGGKDDVDLDHILAMAT